jgi:hypothetical protein
MELLHDPGQRSNTCGGIAVLLTLQTFLAGIRQYDEEFTKLFAVLLAVWSAVRTELTLRRINPL